jgi:protein-tyrosine phosphatase
MNRILPYPLWVGHAGDARDFRQVFDRGVKAVVQLAVEEPPLETPRELVYLRFPLVDGPGNRGELLFLAISTVATLIKMHVPTLVCCSAGLSRAPAMAAAGLAMAHGAPPEECLKQVVQHHHVDVSPGLWQEIVGVLSWRRAHADPLKTG